MKNIWIEFVANTTLFLFSLGALVFFRIWFAKPVHCVPELLEMDKDHKTR